MVTCLIAGACLMPQHPLLTRAESSDYQATSSYADVIEFIEELQGMEEEIRLEWIGESANGYPIPMVVMSSPLPTGPRDIGDRPVVYVQANIHGGEVEGKEAILMLMRDILLQQPISDIGVQVWDDVSRTLLSKLVLVIVPIYNIDGNEALGPGLENRGSQNGPSPIGERANGDGFDLNRDSIKARTPEMQAVLEHVWNRWQPDVMLDLHTTNGTRHGYDLTYSPPLHPNSPTPVSSLGRYIVNDARTRLKDEGFKLFDYGNTQGEPRAWHTFGHEGRYVTNYAGLRGTVGILSEATSYLPFERRVEATYAFVHEILQLIMYLGVNHRTVARRWTRSPLATRFEPASRGVETVILEDPDSEPIEHWMAPTEFIEVEMEVFPRFEGTKFENLPVAYLIDSSEKELIDLLLLHGIVVERLRQPWSGKVGQFDVTEVDVAEREFQGSHLVRLEGSWNQADGRFPAGTYVVRTEQRLWALIFEILEPSSLDGAVAWGFVPVPEPGPFAPVHRSLWVLRAPLERVR